MNDFRLSIDLYGDEGNFGLLVISDSRKQTLNNLPTESFAMKDAIPEEIGKIVIDYLKRNCT